MQAWRDGVESPRMEFRVARLQKLRRTVSGFSAPMKLTADFIRAHAAKHGLPCALDAPPCPPTPETTPSVRPDDAEPPDAFTGAEKLLHRDFAADMERRDCWFVSCRTDQRATIPSGYPDFHVLYTGEDGICRGCAVEFKRAGGSLAELQRSTIVEMRRRGIPVIVAYTLVDAIRFAREKLGC